MAGYLESIIRNQHCKTNTYINGLLEKARNEYGVDSSEFKGIYNQYFKIPSKKSALKNRRYYEAEVTGKDIPKGLERLYRRSVAIDLLSACACECVYCARGYFNRFALSNTEIQEVAKYCANDKFLQEVLITGGDPMIAPSKLKLLITELASKAPNIKIIRIGTRLPVQDPEMFDPSLFTFFESMKKRFIIEVALQANHYFEFQDKAKEVIIKLQKVGCRIYCQIVLLKDVNDDMATLIRLYDEIRYMGLSPYYLFHAIPIIGTEDFRTSVQKGLDLIRQLESCGHLSGRTKPVFEILTDVGKVTLYQGSIIGRDGNYLLIKTFYKLSERRIWNPSFELPTSATLNDDDTITVKYLDGKG